jgi:hypothetical protein
MGMTNEALKTKHFQTRMISNAPEHGPDGTKIGSSGLEMKDEQMDIKNHALTDTYMKILIADCILQGKHKRQGL